MNITFWQPVKVLSLNHDLQIKGHKKVVWDSNLSVVWKLLAYIAMLSCINQSLGLNTNNSYNS